MAATATLPRNMTTKTVNVQVRRVTVFFGSEPRRTETRFCPRRNGDSCSASKSSNRANFGQLDYEILPRTDHNFPTCRHANLFSLYPRHCSFAVSHGSLHDGQMGLRTSCGGLGADNTGFSTYENHLGERRITHSLS